MHSAATLLQRRTGDVAGLFTGLSKAIRQAVQSGSLALGAYLVIEGDLTGGMIIASSVIVTRRSSARRAGDRQLAQHGRSTPGLATAAGHVRILPEMADRTALPAPTRSLVVDAAFVAPPGERQRMTVQNVSFQARAGTVVGVIGPSASGKSSLVRAITAVWPLAKGKVALDGAALDQWSSRERGRHIGYMPQTSDLFPGTIADNIARLVPDADDVAVISAARAAGVHDMIVALPDGYETQVGEGGRNLSAGQRQRVALARALYGDPFLVVLDEPNSNLDGEGERALAEAIAAIRARGGIVVVVAHRNSVLSQIDFLLVMENGAAKIFGPRDQVLKSLQEQRPRAPRAASLANLTVIEGEAAQ